MAGWPPKDYTQFFLFDEPTHTMREIRKEYSRLRDIGVKRAKRLEAAGLTAQAEYLRESFPTLKEIGSNDYEIKNRLAFGHSLIYDQYAYSLSGIKQLQKMIYDETGELIPLGETLDFNEYMKSWRLSAFSKLIVPSGDAADLYKGEYKDVGGTFSDFYTLYKQG